MESRALRPNARIANDFVHDIAAGFFPGSVAGAWVIRGALNALEPGSGAVVERAAGSLWLLFAIAAAVSVGTGLLRTRYWRLNVRSGFMEKKSQTAITKHALFVTALVLSGGALAML